MVNRPRKIGTAFTSSVIAYLRGEGFGQAELRNLAGAADLGDIVGIPGVVIECKGGHAAEQAGDVTVERWLIETEVERVNARADVGLLVVKRKSVGAQRAAMHGAWLTLDGLGALVPVPVPEPLRLVPVRLRLDDAVTLLRAAGYGDPLRLPVERVGGVGP